MELIKGNLYQVIDGRMIMLIEHTQKGHKVTPMIENDPKIDEVIMYLYKEVNIELPSWVNPPSNCIKEAYIFQYKNGKICIDVNDDLNRFIKPI